MPRRARREPQSPRRQSPRGQPCERRESQELNYGARFNPNNNIAVPANPSFSYNPPAGPEGNTARLLNFLIELRSILENNQVRKTNRIIHDASIAGHANTRFLPLFRNDGAIYNQFPRNERAINRLTSKH